MMDGFSPNWPCLPLVLGGLLWITGASITQAQPAPNVKTESDTLAIDPSSTVQIDNQKGSITITTWNRDAVGYEARIVPPNEDGDIPLTTLSVTQTENELDLEPDFPWRFQIPGVITISPGGTERPILHYTVSVPSSVRLEIDSYASTVDVSDVAGRLELDTYEADAALSFSALTGPVSVDSYSGSVQLTLPSDAGFNLETDLQRLDQLTASDALSLPAPSDDEYEGPVNGGGPLLSLESYSGTIELRVP
jgi:hypothetical protein